jgi:holo-[acyl-carrier protein] synthase
MVIVGTGVDIIEISRIKEAVDRSNAFIEKVFTEKEIDYLRSRNFRAEFIAGRFAAKEAVSKALGTGIRGFGFKDIEIDRDELGKPHVKLRGNAAAIAEGFGDYRIHISISHSRDNSIAYVVLEV